MDKQNDVCACNGVLLSHINSAHGLGRWPTGLERLLHPRKEDWHGHVHDCNPNTMRKGGTGNKAQAPGSVRDPDSKEFAESTRVPGILLSLTSVHTYMCVSTCTYMCTYTHIYHRHISPNTKI